MQYCLYINSKPYGTANKISIPAQFLRIKYETIKQNKTNRKEGIGKILKSNFEFVAKGNIILGLRADSRQLSLGW